ncbi:MAG: hypothetical protein Q8878_05910 [Bacillota bacterium]|nr:hypothetical protein [Bacillota bacterium]
MVRHSISDMCRFKVKDGMNIDLGYGLNQEWYKTSWKRGAGCGPTVAANIMCYLNGKDREKGLIKDDCLALMEEVWEYVTPTCHGVNSTKLLCKGITDYSIAKGLHAELLSVDSPKKESLRPDMKSIVCFLEDSLLKDLPVAFLNLCNGSEELLDAWHWVTIVSLTYEDDGSVYTEIIDDGKLIKINFGLWYKTTRLGGGLVRFSFT